MFVRTISKGRWFPPREGELPADCLLDLAPKGNALSFWVLDESRFNEMLNLLAAAYSAGRDYLTEFDYALFKPELLQELGITTSPSFGKTPDSEVNTWHVDLVNLTAMQVSRLAYGHVALGRIRANSVGALIAESIAAHRFDAAALKPELLTSLRRKGLIPA